MKAIERVEELLSRLTGAASRVSGVVVDVSDLRAVLALAKEAAELKRRLASIRYIIKRASHDPDTMAVVRDLLDLRKPLPKRGAR